MSIGSSWQDRTRNRGLSLRYPSSFQAELDQAQTMNRCEFLSGDENSFLKKVSDARARGLTVVGFTAESAKANGRFQLMALLCQ
jgi:hypothetical protein